MSPPRKLLGSGLTLVELLTGITVIGVVAALMLAVIPGLKSMSESATCAASLRNLAAAVHLYAAEHDGSVPPYYTTAENGDRIWYFGRETAASIASPEGARFVDQEAGPLYPYIRSVGSIQICPSFPYGNDYWKPKWQGASFGYGLNLMLSPFRSSDPGSPPVPTPVKLHSVHKPSKTILFADTAQVNTFQAPASASNPLLEEFPYVDNNSRTYHFRHGGKANAVFLDGHVEAFSPWNGTLDTRLPQEKIGLITERRSMKHLKWEH